MRRPGSVKQEVMIQELIDKFLIYLAAERGLSTNYQISTRHSLETFAKWLAKEPAGITGARQVKTQHFSDYLVWRKTCGKGRHQATGMAPASLRLEAIALRVFFRFLFQRNILPRDPAETLSTPRAEKYLPETLSVRKSRV
jgi:integrase/recombinase XerD